MIVISGIVHPAVFSEVLVPEACVSLISRCSLLIIQFKCGYFLFIFFAAFPREAQIRMILRVGWFYIKTFCSVMHCIANA